MKSLEANSNAIQSIACQQAMPHSKSDAPLAKRQKVSSAATAASDAANSSRIFAPFRVRLPSNPSNPSSDTKYFHSTSWLTRGKKTADSRTGFVYKRSFHIYSSWQNDVSDHNFCGKSSSNV